MLKQIQEIVKEYLSKREKDQAECKEIINKVMNIRSSVKDSKEIHLPQYILFDKIEAAAKELQEYFGKVPEKAILCALPLAPHFLELVKLEKVAVITTELEPNQKLPFIYLADYKGQKVVIVDTLQENEDKYPEFYPILPIRMLVRSGVNQFFIFSEAYGVDPSLKPGDAFLFENYMPLNVINPFIGRHHKEWGDRFLDVTEIFTPENNKTVKDALAGSMNLTTQNIMWVNPMKTYGDKAEVRIAQSLRLPAVVSRGMSQALTLHDMKKQFVAVGVIQRNLHEERSIGKEERKAAVEKLISVLSVNLKPTAKEEAH